MKSDLLTWNARGLFCAPNESREGFFQRVTSCPAGSLETPALSLTEQLFDARPDWVEMKIERRGLRFWEGAVTWIEENGQGVKTPSIQMSPSLPASLYSKEETIAHELVHAMRASFEENQFEEILAYRTSQNSLRRFLGPLFSKPAEVKGFLFLILASWFIFIAEMTLDLELRSPFFVWAPFCALFLALFRLVRSQRTFSKALENLKSAIAKPEKALAIALRLSDAEIVRFSRCSPLEIQAYAKEANESSIRWQQLFYAYF